MKQVNAPFRFPPTYLRFCSERKKWRWVGIPHWKLPDQGTPFYEFMHFYCQHCEHWLDNVYELAIHRQQASYCDRYTDAVDLVLRMNQVELNLLASGSARRHVIERTIHSMPTLVPPGFEVPENLDYLDQAAVLLCPFGSCVVLGRNCMHHHFSVCQTPRAATQIFLRGHTEQGGFFPGTRVEKPMLRDCTECDNVRVHFANGLVAHTQVMFKWVLFVVGVYARHAHKKEVLSLTAHTAACTTLPVSMRTLLHEDLLDTVFQFL